MCDMYILQKIDTKFTKATWKLPGMNMKLMKETKGQKRHDTNKVGSNFVLTSFTEFSKDWPSVKDSVKKKRVVPKVAKNNCVKAVFLKVAFQLVPVAILGKR